MRSNGPGASWFSLSIWLGSYRIEMNGVGYMILIIDDDASVCASLRLLLKQNGYRARFAHNPQQALELLGQESFRLVLQDMNFSRQTSGEEGLTLLKQIKELHPGLPVILMTAWGSISLAVRGVRNGAAEFITKPWTHDQLLGAVKTVLGLEEARGRKGSLPNREQLDEAYDFSNLVGRNTRLLEILDLVGRVASTDAPVLITGESGTGKELIAEALHKNSLRREQPFVKVNLGGLSVSLFESELFGHVKGAYTDAGSARKGRFATAHGGSIFLDEIGDLAPDCQVKLLRVLQDRTFEPLGSSTAQQVDVRVVSATNRALADMVADGSFREDLLYRLNLIAVHLPSLRERRDDIPLVANHFLGRMASIYRKESLTLSDGAVNWLSSQEWPGNIRQLKQTVERAVLMSQNPVLEVEDFTSAHRMAPLAETRMPQVGAMTLEEMERAMIVEALGFHQQNISKAAESLGLSRASLYRRLEKFGLAP